MNQKLPKRVQAVADKCRSGQTLCKFLRQKDTGETETIFFFEPSGRRCGPKSAIAAIAAGLLKPNHDGLFGESQTWIAS